MYMGEPGDPGLFVLLPMLMIGAGVLVLGLALRWLGAQEELERIVLEALPETEGLPGWAIAERPPLASRRVDQDTLLRVLERLRERGVAVRWYEELEAAGPGGAVQRVRCPVYRRVRRASSTESAADTAA